MKNLKSKLIAIAATLSIAISTGAVRTASAQVPPPQGPPPATANAAGLPVSIITNGLMDKVNEKVAKTNAHHDGIEDDPTNPDDTSHRFHISASQESWGPYMTQTEYTDRPNQRIAHLSYIVTYNLSNLRAKKAGVWVSYPFSRTITQSIDVNVSCEGWYTGVGVLTFTPRIQPPYLEGDHSFVEDVFGALLNNYIPNYVDGQIRNALQNFQVSAGPTSTGLQCSTLGVVRNPDAITFEVISGPRLPILTAINNDITVRVTQIKRLPLHTLHGAVLYDALENPNLQIYAGYATSYMDLNTMVEGSIVTPGSNAARTPVPSGDGQLVVIGSLTYDQGWQTDSNYLVFGKNSNYGNGTQTFSIYKTWFEQSPFAGGKPIQMKGKAYEVTVQITSPILVNTVGGGVTDQGGTGGGTVPGRNLGAAIGAIGPTLQRR